MDLPQVLIYVTLRSITDKLSTKRAAPAPSPREQYGREVGARKGIRTPRGLQTQATWANSGDSGCHSPRSARRSDTHTQAQSQSAFALCSPPLVST